MRSDLPTDADVVVVGTGAFGLAVAVHLARFGAGRVLALDRFDVGSQTSPRAAGLFKSVQADYLRTRLAALAIEIVRGFEKDMGVPVPYVQSGSLMIARTERHARVIETEIAAARRWGVTCDSITTAELVRLAPYVEPSTVQYAAYVPEDIYIEEPSALLEAYRLAAERLGARVLGHVPATNIVLGDGGVEAVETPYGRVRTETVIDAAGAWVRAVGRMAGIDLAVMPMRHQLAITEALPGTAATHPITRIVDAAVYVRPCRGGLMWGGFESNPLALEPTNHGEQFRIDNLPLDFSVLEGFAQAVRDVVPALADAPIQEHRGGLFTMTPDGRFVAGPVPNVRGLWVLSGCNGSGFSFSPALGRLVAEWIVTGEPSYDLTPFAPSRWPTVWDEATLVQAAIYQYTHYYEPLEAVDGEQS